MAEYMKKASNNLQPRQELQKQWHDQKAVLTQYHPGQKVWVLEPLAPGALQDKWNGPHLIVEKKGEVTYLVDLGTAKSPLRVLHVNRLKPYYDRADLTLLMATDEGQEAESDPLPDVLSTTEADGLVEGVGLADCLTAEQKGYLWNKGTKSKSHKQVGDGQMPRKCQLRVQRSFYWTEEAEVSAGTKRARDFPFGGRIPLAVESRAEVFSRRKDANKPC
ncbi:hypothetical protein NDU88_003504 [Pleurodeles waltl]|uniref:Integrase p58-like C-terminal domain-containing protein n=1 Tax=Pleurodeles waltl TaxID=8319 RepID=A0AAV7M5B7_PLEWA|nr:hypothetical protein NDU88_003504 [Pleurodeles waltl]